MGSTILNIFSNILLFPFMLESVVWLNQLLGRTLSVVASLICFGIGALLCTIIPLGAVGAPICLISLIIAFKAII